MARVTSKLQVTVPKSVADHYGIRPGDDIEWVVSGETIRVVPPRARTSAMTGKERLRRFDQATARQRKRNKRVGIGTQTGRERGWTREDLYRRGSPR